MVALIQSENHAANNGKMAGRHQFVTHLTRIGLRIHFRGGGRFCSNFRGK